MPSARPCPTRRASSKNSAGIEALAIRSGDRVEIAHAAGLSTDANRAAVSRTSAIMLGMPWVRLALRCLRKVERLQRGRDVGLRDLSRRLVLDRRQHQRDDALGDRGIAVGEEVQAVAVVVRCG